MADWDHRTIREVDYVIGACQVIRHRALQEVGPFDVEMADWDHRTIREVDYVIWPTAVREVRLRARRL